MWPPEDGQPRRVGEFVKSRNPKKFVIPAKAGIQLFQDVLNPGFRRGDDEETFYEIIRVAPTICNHFAVSLTGTEPNIILHQGGYKIIRASK